MHAGRYHGAGDWPPAPARLFQAWLAGAAGGGRVPAAAGDALDWLERLPPPAIAAPRGTPGQAYTSFVPNNDLDAALAGKHAADLPEAVASTRVRKLVRPILFDADEPLLYCWRFDGDAAPAALLCETAAQIYQLGRGIDMAWADAAVVDPDEAEQRLADHPGIVYHPSANGGGGRTLLCPRPGTRRSLADRFEGVLARFRPGQVGRRPVQVFVQPPKPLLASIAYNAPPVRIVFALRRRDAQGGFAARPLAEVTALVAEARDAAARRLAEAVPALADEIARYLVGRGATDRDKAARVRIVPVPSVGYPGADLLIRQLAVYVPRACPVRPDDVAWAFAQVAWRNAGGAPVAGLQRADDDTMTARYETVGRHWRSVTPLVLGRAARRRDTERPGVQPGGTAGRAGEEARAAHAVRQALRHAAIRVPPTSVSVQREPFDGRGTRAADFAAGTRFPGESLWHAAVSFAAPVAGPLLLGDGRYTGLGLMRTVDRMPGVLAMAIEAGLVDGADPALVARAARRAMLARVQALLPRGESLPTYVSGHTDDGGPARSGTHRHIAVVPDLPRRRLLYITPSTLWRVGVSWQDVCRDHHRVERALAGMSVLRAGRAGRLILAPATVEAQSDPLFAPSREWRSVSDYRVARHHRRMGDADALTADAVSELERARWPAPARIDVLSVRRGARGGLSGRLRLTFATAQAGPLAIGRTAHAGGGLFATSA